MYFVVSSYSEIFLGVKIVFYITAQEYNAFIVWVLNT